MHSTMPMLCILYILNMYDKLRIDFEDKTFINYHIFKKMNCDAGVLLD